MSWWLRRLLPFLLLGVLVAYATLVHHGLGPRPDGNLHWWSPRSFLWRELAGSAYSDWLADLRLGMAVFLTPALLLVVACFAATRSALLRTCAVSAAASTGLFAFYALSSNISRFAWNLFHWRGSATLVALGFVIGVCLVAPWLAARWLKLRWPARLLVYLPVFLAVVAVERNVTGTNSELVFAISPWPVVPVFGLETLASTLAAQAAGVSLGLLGLARLRRATATPDRVLGTLTALLGLVVPAAWLWLGSQGLLPFRVGARGMVTAVSACTVLLLLAATVRIRWRPHGLRYRGLTFGTGALLLSLPLFVGQACARLDYRATRDGRAAELIQGLQAYYERELVYPERLDELVENGDLAEVPGPRIGFGPLSNERSFRYQAFGTSYLLEFSAPRWVQCAYNPPYPEEDDWEGGDGNDDEDLGGSWSCPSTPPELW